MRREEKPTFTHLEFNMEEDNSGSFKKEYMRIVENSRMSNNMQDDYILKDDFLSK